ncbi:MAG: hypothetical protein KKH72_15040 [Alphaproteobacteria bacterium]|nr:hypothetical protein [Alphaproteobacteria bacterium]
MQVADRPRGVGRSSANHDAEAWPGMLLPGTYNAIMARALLGGLDAWRASEKAVLSEWLLGFRRSDGVFRVPGMRDDTVFKKPDLDETWRYIDFHVTNYTLGALQALDPELAPVLDFVAPFLEPLRLKAWMADRDLRDPWQEGNNIVNLGSFLLLVRKWGSPGQQAAANAAIDYLFEWHTRNQNPQTGFWGVGQSRGGIPLLHAMAGSMHNYHLYYACRREIPNHVAAVDYTLNLATGIHSACIDVDEIDLLVHAADTQDYRRGEIADWLRCKLVALLDFQRPDGGFADALSGELRQDGWIGGYSEPQGHSNAFSTWFRWIGMAMADQYLWPGRRDWHFRSMIGIGYRRPTA